jgi:hypothetical protein
MPVRRGLPRTRPAAATELEGRLTTEFTTPTEQGQPLVFEEPPEPAPVSRIFVVWDDWASLSQQDRSEIILRAYERAKGEQAALTITVAMGLTATEAERMGIPTH